MKMLLTIRLLSSSKIIRNTYQNNNNKYVVIRNNKSQTIAKKIKKSSRFDFNRNINIGKIYSFEHCK